MSGRDDRASLVDMLNYAEDIVISGPEATAGSTPMRRKTNGTTAPITAASLNDQIKG